MEVSKWQLYHTYNKLVAMGSLPPIVHPGCGAVLIPRYKDNPDNFRLWCPECDVWTTPGLGTMRNIESAVQEFFDVRLVV